jgi:O-antigen/teichoic acid export membrane protein
VTIARQFLKNILSSWVAYAIRLALGFLFVPYITSVFGSEQYGVWVIIFQAISYISLFDLGFERAVVRFVAKYYAQGDEEAVRRTLSTSQGIFLILAPAVLIAVSAVALLLFDFVKVSDVALRSDGQIALIIIGVLLTTRFALGTIHHALQGLQRFDIINAIDIGEEILRFGSMALLLSMGYGMIGLAIAILGVNVLRLAAAWIWLHAVEPTIRWDPRAFDKERFKELYGYSKMSFGITIAWLVIFGSDSILLGMIASASAAGIYAPAAQLMLYMRHVINAIGIPLAPAISHLEAKGRDYGVVRTYLAGLKYVTFISFFLSCGVIIFARPFVSLWLPSEFAQTADVMMILAVGSAIFLPQIIGNSILFGIERHRYLFYVLVCEAVLKIGLSFLLIGEYGAKGMAIAAAVPQVILYLTIYPYFMSKVLGQSLPHLLGVAARSGFLAILATVATGLAMRTVLPPETWPTLLCDTAVTGGVALAVGWSLVVERSERDRLMSAFRSRFAKS